MSRLSLLRLHRHALITGASSGLGRAFAEMLLAEGLTVHGTARDPARLADLAAAHPGTFHPLALDLADPASIAAAWQTANAAAPGIDLLINNAGYGVFAESASIDFAPWRTQLDSLLTNTLSLAHAALRDMLERRPAADGAIVNISSLAAEFPIPGMSGYNAAKAGLSAWTESLAWELRGTGVRVIDFRPGDFRTPFNQAAALPADLSPAWQRVWRRFEAMHAAAPLPAVAVRDLRRALLRRRSGMVRSGSFFQARLAPLLARLGWWRIRHAIQARYFDL
ncbi:short-chain dehydrogenase of unknown substrate specificity [Opitutaceae bacterium TAV1]|nr:short-chain dehydrogenase of unknown substrate specificity [Opitutaceae bacterium TAV1]